jgi:hypothetical protein
MPEKHSFWHAAGVRVKHLGPAAIKVAIWYVTAAVQRDVDGVINREIGERSANF